MNADIRWCYDDMECSFSSNLSCRVGRGRVSLCLQRQRRDSGLPEGGLLKVHAVSRREVEDRWSGEVEESGLRGREEEEEEGGKEDESRIV